MKRIFPRSLTLLVSLLFAAAVLVSVAAYPEVFVMFKHGVVTWSDYNVEYVLTFVLTQFFYQGGIQLWDYYGQIPFDYTLATFGLFKFQNVMTALCYYLLAPFSDYSAELYHHVFIWAYLFSHLFLRVTGIFLLLTRVTGNVWILSAGTVLFSVFFSQPAFLWGSFSFSYVPLFLYFILRFFERLELSYLSAMFLFFVVCLGTSIIHTGYMYVAVHFFVISALAWSLVVNRQGWRDLISRCKGFQWFHWRNAVFLLLIALVVVGPYAYCVKVGFKEVAFEEANSRISELFSISFYFKKLQISLADPRFFFKDTLNFEWAMNPTVFFGCAIFILALTGLVLSRKSVKWVFGLAVLLLWLLNHPRESLNIGHIAHWINALTNPIKNFPRSYYVSSYVSLAYFLMPLAALGVAELLALYRGRQHSHRRWGILIASIILLMVTSAPLLPADSRHYLLASAGAAVVSMAWFAWRRSPSARRSLAATIVLICLADIGLVIDYSKQLFSRSTEIKPAIFAIAPKAGSVGFEFHNPKIFPFKEYATSHFSFDDETHLWFPRGLSGNVHHMINHKINFLYINGHSPRHKAYEQWIDDKEMADYIEQNTRVVYLAQQAVKASPGTMGWITSSGHAQDVVMVDDPSGKLNLPERPREELVKFNEEIRYAQEAGLFKFDTMLHNTYHVKGDMIIFIMGLPKEFPKHLSTTLFPEDQKSLHFYAQLPDKSWLEFTPAQGDLIRPYTFDVQNIKEGQLTAAIPKNTYLSKLNYNFLFAYDRNEGVLNIWRSQYDNLGMTYRAGRDGWLVFQYPYSAHWKITIDGKGTDYYRVNKSFIGVPVSKGDHKILVQYNPGSFLRTALLLSVILTTLGLPALILFGLRNEQKEFDREKADE
jgi:hypothetical protein